MEKFVSNGLRSVAHADGHHLHPMAERAACTDCSLFITGETGSGKGHLARWIHDHSGRSRAPFVPVNCGAIPQDLMDSHLFGHAKGAFSGATHDHAGMFRAASGGTILLDEVGELPLHAQARLLRVLEEKEVQPVGVERPIVVNVRVIAATNADLGEQVRQGRFRQDLFFRLDIVRISMMPLRERRCDIARLIELFNTEFASLYGQPVFTFEPEAITTLLNYPWPGNVREVRTVIERLHVLRGPANAPVTCKDLQVFGQLRVGERPRHLMRSGAGQEAAGNRVHRFHEVKLKAVNDMLSACRGNVSSAALKLGVHRSTIYRWLAHQPVSA